MHYAERHQPKCLPFTLVMEKLLAKTLVILALVWTLWMHLFFFEAVPEIEKATEVVTPETLVRRNVRLQNLSWTIAAVLWLLALLAASQTKDRLELALSTLFIAAASFLIEGAFFHNVMLPLGAQLVG